MKGFFSAAKGKSDVTLKNPQSCASCGLYRHSHTPRLPAQGKGRKGVMFIGEASGDLEDKKGLLWQGRVGRMFLRTLKNMGFNGMRDGVHINAVGCLPDNYKSGKAPPATAIYCCRKQVTAAIEEHKPKVIILLGVTAMQSVIGRLWKTKIGAQDRWRGYCIPDRALNAWICPTFHPYYVTQKEERSGENLAEVIWKQDLKRALSKVDEKLPAWHDEASEITYIKKAKELKLLVPDLMNAELLSFDYETTGIKPHHPNQKLLSVGAVIGKNKAYGWINTPVMSKLFSKVMQSTVPKTAHHLQFEDAWTFFKMGVPVNRWEWCSMNAAHILDNRRGITSLKFQTYINFGAPDYDTHLSAYIKSPKKEGSNALNKMENFIKDYGVDELLKYNVLDAIYGYNLSVKQGIEMGVPLCK